MSFSACYHSAVCFFSWVQNRNLYGYILVLQCLKSSFLSWGRPVMPLATHFSLCIFNLLLGLLFLSSFYSFISCSVFIFFLIKVFCTVEKTEGGDLINAYQYLMSGSQVAGAMLCLAMPSIRTRGRGHRLEHGKFHLNMREKFFAVRLTDPGKGCPEWWWSLLLWRYSRLTDLFFSFTESTSILSFRPTDTRSLSGKHKAWLSLDTNSGLMHIYLLLFSVSCCWLSQMQRRKMTFKWEDFHKPTA